MSVEKKKTIEIFHLHIHIYYKVSSRIKTGNRKIFDSARRQMDFRPLFRKKAIKYSIKFDNFLEKNIFSKVPTLSIWKCQSQKMYQKTYTCFHKKYHFRHFVHVKIHSQKALSSSCGGQLTTLYMFIIISSWKKVHYYTWFKYSIVGLSRWWTDI